MRGSAMREHSTAQHSTAHAANTSSDNGHRIMKRVSKFKAATSAPVILAGALLTGCAAKQSPSLYQWGAYQPQVYEYFKGQTGSEAQIDALEQSLQQIRANGDMPPPGFHAQLGMLYASVGKSGQAMQEFEAEKELFPESSAYMDFLMKKKSNSL